MRSTLLSGLALILAMLCSAPLAQAADPTTAPAPAPPTQPAPGTPPAEAKPLLEAYAQTNTYQASKTVVITQRMGDQEQKQEVALKVAFDRPGQKLRVETDQFLLVLDGQKLRLKAASLQEKYLEIDAPKPLTFRALMETAGMIAPMLVPDVIFLLGGEEFVFQQATVAALEPDAQDAQKRPRLEISGPEGKLTLRLNAKTQLVEEAQLETPPGPQGQTVTVLYQVETLKRNEPLAADTFAFDAGAAKAVHSMDKMAPEHPLIGQEAPSFTLKAVDGSEVTLTKLPEQVVILDFWATWCGPCRESLPKLQEVYDWARQEKKSVAIYTIDLQETAAQVEPFWKEKKLTMPVLLDSDGQVANAYQVTGIPHTVVIHQGKVAAVHVGLGPNMVQNMKQEIDHLLASAPAATQPAATQPAAAK